MTTDKFTIILEALTVNRTFLMTNLFLLFIVFNVYIAIIGYFQTTHAWGEGEIQTEMKFSVI
jgi:hypothetical protein